MISNKEAKCNSSIRLEFNASDVSSDVGRSFATKFDASRQLSTSPIPEFADIAIIGAGIHGFGMLVQLLNDRELGAKKVVLIGDDDELCGRFLNSIKSTGQTVLRSPYEHQLAPDGFIQMLDFARLYSDSLSLSEKKQIKISLMSARSIVPLDVFQGHINYLSSACELRKHAFQGRVTYIHFNHRSKNYVISVNGQNPVKAKKLILATGAVSRLRDAPISFTIKDKIAVSGAGLSAAQFVIDAAKAGLTVYWDPKTTLEFQCSDVPHKYFRHEGITAFQSLSHSDRLSSLRQATQSSIMPELKEPLTNLVNQQKLHFVDQIKIKEFKANSVRVKEFSGYSPECTLLNRMEIDLSQFSDEALECSDLRGLFISGWLALRNVGPAAKNIDGVRICYERIRASLFDLNPTRQSNVMSFPKSYIKGTSPNRS